MRTIVYVVAVLCILHTTAFAPLSRNRFPLFTHQEDSSTRHEDDPHHRQHQMVLIPRTFGRRSGTGFRHYATAALHPVSADMEGVPIPFIDRTTNTFIDCYADCWCQLDGITYTVGVPCDTAVSICRMGPVGQLITLDEAEIDDVFSVAAAALQDEFDEELVLQRTPQTLTLAGELVDDDDDDDDDEDDDDEVQDELDHTDSSEDDEDVGTEEDEEGDESVELLMSFDHRGAEYVLVRMLDPVLLVGVLNDGEGPEIKKRYLLTVEESEKVMPVLEDMFLEYNDKAEDDDDDDDDDDDIEDFTVLD
jgi:Protein of unknown function (DUF3727)